MDLVPPRVEHQSPPDRDTRYRRRRLVSWDLASPHWSAYPVEFDAGSEKLDEGLEIDIEDYWSWVPAPQSWTTLRTYDPPIKEMACANPSRRPM